MDFPSRRFLAAGATGEEIEQLQERFDALPEHAQASHLEHLASVAHGDLIELLEQHRHRGEEAAEDDQVDGDGNEEGSSESEASSGLEFSDGSKA